MRRFIHFLGFALVGAAQFAFADGALEIPGNGSVQSGITVISGWNCNASNVEIRIDGGQPLGAAYGTTRADTKGICGDENNGFGLLLHMGLLGSGQHTIVAYANGVEFDRSTFTVTDIADGGFLTDAQGETRIHAFPDSSTDLILKWQQANQNFVIARQEPSADPHQITGIWQVPNYALISVHVGETSNGVAPIVAISTALDDSFTEIFQGTISGGVGKLATTYSSVSVTAKITVTSISHESAQVRIDSCTPSYACAAPSGTIAQMARQF